MNPRYRVLSVFSAIVLSLLLAVPVLAQWTQTTGPYSTTVYCFAASGSTLWAGAHAGVYLSTDGGATWTTYNNSLTNADVECLITSPDGKGGTNLFAGRGYGGAYLSADSGKTWTNLYAGLTPNSARSLAISGTDVFAGTSNGVFLSTDNGSNWTSESTGLPANSVVYSLAASGANVFAGTGTYAYLSTDNGSSWTQIKTGLTSNTVGSFAFVPTGAGGTQLFAGAGSVYQSSDDGVSWTGADSGFTNRPVTCLAVSGTNLFAGTNGRGVYFSTDNGSSWKSINTGLTDTAVYALGVSDSYLFVGLYQGGVWRRPLSQVVTEIEHDVTQVPSVLSLEQNYPNPFNPTTTIGYVLPMSGHITLKVYDILGREVATLVDAHRNAGNYQMGFDGSRIASGVYFYQLRSGSFVQTKKLVLMK